jgi:hypothetical protein
MNPAIFHDYIITAYIISAAMVAPLALQAWLRGKYLRRALMQNEAASDEA